MSSPTKLTDTQFAILSAASQRKDRCLSCAKDPESRRAAEGRDQASDSRPGARDQSEGRNGSLAARRRNGPSVFVEID